MNSKKKIKGEEGAITLYVLISIMFFIVVVLGIYVNSSNKIQKQDKEIAKIQKEYQKNNINDIYEEVYEKYVNTEMLTIEVYEGNRLKQTIIGEEESSSKTIYLVSNKITLKLFSKNISDKYAYATTAEGEKIEIEGNTLEVDITTEGTTIYTYIIDEEGNCSKNYTAVTMILVT